jgi:hypothetical protein
MGRPALFGCEAEGQERTAFLEIHLHSRILSSVGFGGWVQPIDATHSANFSAGV